MENTGLSAADVALLNRDTGFGDGNSFMWIFALLILAGGGFGGLGGWGNGGGVNALNADMQRGFDTQNLQSQTRDILSAVTSGTAQTIAASTQNASNAISAIKDGNASLIREFGNVEAALTALSGRQQECCCDVKQLVQATSSATQAQIAQSEYNAALRDAATNANITAQVQSIKDMMYQQKEQAQAQRIQQLELAQATSGMLRFPNSWSYGAGPFPPIFGCCGNNNI